MLKIVALVSVLLTSFAVPFLAQSDADPAGQLREKWVKSWNSKQLDELLKLYAEDAVLSPPSGERIVGTDKIRIYFKAIFDGASSLNIRVDSKKEYASGELEYDNGVYEDTVTRAGGVSFGGNIALGGNLAVGGGGGKSTTQGSYLVVVRRDNGRWLIVQQATTEVTQSATH